MADLTLHNLTTDDKALLVSVGITTKAQFEKLGADKTYKLLEETSTTLDDNLIFRLRGAEHDIDWQILADQHKRRATSRFADIDEV